MVDIVTEIGSECIDIHESLRGASGKPRANAFMEQEVEIVDQRFIVLEVFERFA